MDPKPAKYAVQDEVDIVVLIERHPLAWLVTAEGGFAATPLPLRPVLTGGRLTALSGHFARSNAQVSRLRAHPRALILFMGLQSYVSPSWMADRTQAPTWNYASAVFDCDITLIDDSEGISASLNDLIEASERGRPNAWAASEMGARYTGLARGVVAFQADIRETQAVFKVGQDERDDVFADILVGLESEGAHDLTALMRRYRPAK